MTGFNKRSSEFLFVRHFVFVICIFSLFNKSGTQYDFTVDISSLKQKCDELEIAQKGMKKKINPKVMNMIDR